MKSADVYPSKWLAAADLANDDESYKEPLVTIDRVVLEEISNTEEKPVMYFKDRRKGMIVNKTNWKRLEYILKSDESDNWHGKQITLYVELVDMRGEMKPALRVKPPKRNGSATPNAQISTGPEAKPVKPTMLPVDTSMDDEVPF